MELKRFEEYEAVSDKEVVDKIRQKAEKLKGKRIVCVNATHIGGGVAEMLNSMVPLFNDLGIDFGWRVLHGFSDFFNITKKCHNSLQGEENGFSEKEKDVYCRNNQRFASFTHLNHDLVVIHDPQPMALIDFYEKKQPWVLRLHIDISNPNKIYWDYLKQFMLKYDEIVVSNEKFKKDIPVKQRIMYPAIDPLVLKNKQLSKENTEEILNKYGVKMDKPVITQISRFDPWKDPEGVVEVFKKVREKVDCRLILMGNTASDDPEGIRIYRKIIEKYGDEEDIKIILNAEDNDFLVNILQRESDIIMQKSTREGFGLTVTEAMYKETPVVASNIGGIPLQVVDGETGFLHDPKDYDSFVESIIKLIENPALRKEMGKKAKEHIRKNFLITRLMLDWLNLFDEYLG